MTADFIMQQLFEPWFLLENSIRHINNKLAVDYA